MLKNTKIIEYIKKSPKTELHLHIEGTLEPHHMFELAKRNNISIPYKNVQEVKSAYFQGRFCLRSTGILS